jgi:hypothetical protein
MTGCIVVDKYASSEKPAASKFRMNEDGGIFFFWNAFLYPPVYRALHHRRQVAYTLLRFVTRPINSRNMNLLTFSANMHEFLKNLGVPSKF